MAIPIATSKAASIYTVTTAGVAAVVVSIVEVVAVVGSGVWVGLLTIGGYE